MWELICAAHRKATVTNPTNDYRRTPRARLGIECTGGAMPPPSPAFFLLVPGKEISGSRERSDIEKQEKEVFRKTIHVILTAAAASWISSTRRFQRTDRISFSPLFSSRFFLTTSQMQAKDLFTIRLAVSQIFFSPRRVSRSWGETDLRECESVSGGGSF